MEPVSFDKVTVRDPFWAPRMEINRTTTLALEYRQMKDTGRIDVFRLDWTEGKEPRPHQFWDSDVAKWVEAASYSLATHPDPELERLLDETIELIAGAQQPDGYLNTYFTLVEPENRWKNLRDMHELYCAGHLMEAAVAHFRATGKRTLLDVMIRYADYIDSVFGEGPGKRYGAPGHEEIELALVKLYHVTGQERYLRLAEFFLNQRGLKPSVFQMERPGEEYRPELGYHQDHLPVREQTTAEGHAVRAMYLYSAMADVAAETGDAGLLKACETLWQNVTSRRMYVTGGVGSSAHGERFTDDYDLPNETAYAETCAAIGLVFWAHRMLQLSGDSRYADVMERALYNGTVSGLSLDGTKFFYVNPLESAGGHHRQDWFGCACCPPNIARMVASLGGYVYSISGNALWVHLYVAGSGQMEIGGHAVTVEQESDYPWDGKITLRVKPDSPALFALHLRIPDWCEGAATLHVDGAPVVLGDCMNKGYACIEREWTGNETVTLMLPMPVLRLRANPAVRHDAGLVALQRGPVLFCVERADNPAEVHRLSLPDDAQFEVEFVEDLLGGVVVLRAVGLLDEDAGWQDVLYAPVPVSTKPLTITAIPYCVWDNREPGPMRVWLRRC
ncbi:MAG: glycoside hydrolase family 127 protein [Armatimonadetes bacterium]|nr:glycoside hydrolase family 127 protein [Armatimonadota bacterium]